MGHLTDKSTGVLTVRFRPNVAIDLECLRNYLEGKDIGEQEVGIESKQQIKKVSWVDDDNVSFFSPSLSSYFSLFCDLFLLSFVLFCALSCLFTFFLVFLLYSFVFPPSYGVMCFEREEDMQGKRDEDRDIMG